jgi:hypothetical protein
MLSLGSCLSIDLFLALYELFSEYSLGGIILNQIIVPTPPDLPYKAKSIMNWFSDSRLPLRRFVVLIEPLQNSTI